MTSPLDALDAADRARLTESDPPRGSATMKATLTDERFDDPAWIFERKFDGVRCLAIRDAAHVRLLSRNDLPLNDRYPEVALALRDEPAPRFAVDGEVVAFDGAQTSFQRLAERGHRPGPVFFYAFDVLWLDGYDVRALSLQTRKRLLRRTLTFAGDAIRWTPHRREHGRASFEDACRRGWEGVIAKREASVYTDRRSRDWLKFKCGRGQELVVGGYTDPRGSRVEFGALLLGYYDGGALRYAGKVGTGFDEVTLHEIGRRLRALRVDGPPFADPALIREHGVHWVRPELVAQVGFTEWTRAGRLRHPRFLGLRDDKPPNQVVRER